MTPKDFTRIQELYCEGSYRDIETMQPSARNIKVDRDLRNSTDGVWGGITDPSRGPSMYTPSVDEEVVETSTDKIKKLIQHEIDVAPKKMTYAKRVLKKLLDNIDSL